MKRNEFAKNILKFSIPSIISAFVALCVLPIISRIYPEDEYGYISNFYSFGNLLMGVFLLGLDSAYIRFYNESMHNTNRTGMFLFVTKIGIVTSLISACVIFIFFREKASIYLFNDTSSVGLILIYIYVVFLMLYRMLNINNRFSGKITAYNIQQVSFIIGNRLLFVFAAIFSTKYLPSIIIMLVSTVLVVIASFAFQRNEFLVSIISKFTKMEMLKFALPIMPTTIIVFLNNSIAKLILGEYGFRNDVGILAIATSAANVFSVIPAAFNTYWGAFMYKNYNVEKKLILDVHDFIIVLSITLVLAIFLFQDSLYLLLGASYRGSQPYFMLIMLSPVFLLLSETTVYGIALSKKTKYTLITAIIGCVLNVLLCRILIPINGSLGAAIGIAASSSVIFISRTIIAQRFYRSVANYFTTTVTCIILVVICSLNVFYYNNLMVRIGISVLAIVMVIILYYNAINNFTIKVKTFVYNKFWRGSDEE